jgi:hypothetical protein
MFTDLMDGSAVIEQNPHPCFDKAIRQGYRICFIGPTSTEGTSFFSWFVYVRNAGQTVSEADFLDDGTCFSNQNVMVDIDHRRRGLGNAIYVFAEKVAGKVLHNLWAGDPHQSPEAKALWAQPNRPFGPQRRSTS